MPKYEAPIEDMRFLLNQVFDFDAVMSDMGQTEVDAALAIDILTEGGKLCSEVLNPINAVGDREGSRLENGSVRTPAGFADAYKAYVEGGWPSISGDPDYGGQGLPGTVEALFNEMLSSANLSFGLFPGLTRGAVEAIQHHANEELKATYLPKMISGEWTGVMALTESHAGTDIGLLKTRAEPQGDGSYKITGTKIFISSGDHDFGGNIIHLVLARLPDAPEGVKGISLFLVPKLFLDAEGEPASPNALGIGALEHKMGIHAQPTCVVNYDGATGWLVGSPHKGLNAMFTMMNAERLFVGIQGLGIGEAAYQGARDYALERLQGRSSDGSKGPVPIIEHPDVRKMLLTARSWNEAGRALAAWTALQMDISKHHPDADKRASAEGFVALLTPVLKAALTDFGFEAAVLAQQVFGGHGYICEWGMEQFVRDARITQIYEGTNGVQALDLTGRKLTFEDGRLAQRFIALMRAELDAAADVAEAARLAEAARKAVDRLESVTAVILDNFGSPGWVGSAATDYLRLFALTSYAWLWARMAASAANNRSDLGNFADDKIGVARFFCERVLPQTLALEAQILAGPASITSFENIAV